MNVSHFVHRVLIFLLRILSIVDIFGIGWEILYKFVILYLYVIAIKIFYYGKLRCYKNRVS